MMAIDKKIAKKPSQQMALPPKFSLISRYIKNRGASEIVFVSEGDKTVVKVLDKDYATMVEATFPKFMPDGIWVVDPGKFAAIGGGGMLEVVGDKIVYRGEDGNAVEIGERRDYDPIPNIEKRIGATAEASINAEVLKAAAKTGRGNMFLGFKLTPEGLTIGAWSNYGGEGAVVKIPSEYVREFKGNGTVYVWQKYLLDILPLLGDAKTVKLRWADDKPLELIFDVDGIPFKAFVVFMERDDYMRANWNNSSGEQIGVLDMDSYKILQKAGEGLFTGGIYTAKMDYYNQYCAKMPLKLKGTWEFYAREMPRLDLFYALGQQPRLFARGDILYVEGWEIGRKSDKDAPPPPCPDVPGGPLPPAVVNAMKNAWEVAFKQDGIYIVPEKYDKNEVQIARAKLNIEKDIRVSRHTLSKLPGSTWRLGVTKDGIVVIDAGNEKLIATS